MDAGSVGCGGASGGGTDGSDGGRDQSSGRGEGIKRKMGDLETSMKAMNDKLVKENAEKSAKIRRLMEETLLRLETPPFQGPGIPNRPVTRPDPFGVFPPEIWEVIIEKMTRYSDLEILCLAFPELERLVMERKKTIVLFKNVLLLISMHLDWKDIINCRLVCQKWNQDLCAIMANSRNPNVPPNISSVPTPYRGPSARFHQAYDFSSSTKIERFLEKMSTHPGNPLFGRFVRFSVYSNKEADNFWKSSLKLVEKFGEHVWSFEISYLRECYNLIDFYKALQQLLLHLPNLRNLQVNCCVWGKGPSEEKVNLAAQLWNAPLPPLPYLQKIKLGLNSETEMMTAFTPYFSHQIRHLKVDRETMANLKTESLQGLINLQIIELQLRSEKDVLYLLKFPTTNLKKIRLHGMHCPATPDSISSEEFASLSEKFSQLEHLDLRWCGGEISSFLGSRIQFSELKTLKIQVGIGEGDLRNNLDYLLRIPSLKHLVIQICYPHDLTDINDYENHSALKIRKYLLNSDDMLESNVWTLMPSLELLELKGRMPRSPERYPMRNAVFTREMFENRVGGVKFGVLEEEI